MTSDDLHQVEVVLDIENRATAVIREIRNAVATWGREADGLGISRREQEMMIRAFLPNES